MISALLYLQFHSVWNRLVMRVKRLKQPKYLLGGIVGGLYFYWYFFRPFLVGVGKGPALSLFGTPESRALYESLGALILFVVLVLAWLLPHERAALTFTEAEVAFLFPAPISRRTLIHFKLLRSQMAILFTTLLLTLITNRAGGRLLIHVAGWWLMLSTLNLHMIGSSFARTKLLDRGITSWQRRGAILGVVALAAVVVAAWARSALPPLDLSTVQGVDGVGEYAQRVLTSGPLPYLLSPLRLIVRPYLAPNAPAFLAALGPAVLVLVLHYLWVVRSDVAFEEASVEASRRMAEKVAAARAGNWQGVERQPKRKRPPFVLRPTGSPAVALLWKNLICAGQIFTVRLFVSLSVFAVVASFAFGQAAGTSGVRPVLGVIAAVLMFWSLLIGPQFLRQDFRQDLALVDLLKTYPMRGWQVALGELLAPAAALTGIQWFLLILVEGLFAELAVAKLDKAAWLAIGFGAALNIPLLNLVTLQIPNAGTLLFPSWFHSPRGSGGGIEVTGQRLIFLLGQMIVFALALLPAAAFFAAVFFLLKGLLGLAVAILLGAVAGAMILAVETAGGVMLLGWMFSRFDVSAEVAP